MLQHTRNVDRVRADAPRVRVSAQVRAFMWAVPAFKAMLVSGAEETNGVNNAVGALRRICAVPEARDAAFAAGVPVALETAFETASPDARSLIAWAASNMCVRGARVCAVDRCVCTRVCDMRCARGTCRCGNAAYVRALRVWAPAMRSPLLFSYF